MNSEEKLPGRVNRKKNYQLQALYDKLYELEFLHQPGNYTVDDLKILVGLIFKGYRILPQYKIPLCTIAFCLEELSEKFSYTNIKRCDFTLLEKAFLECFFEVKGDFLDKFPNIVKPDYHVLKRLLRHL